MSGRVADVEVALHDRNIVYVGGSTGGVFKSSDAGLTWAPVFDSQDALGVGSIAVFQANPDIVWGSVLQVPHAHEAIHMGRGRLIHSDAGAAQLELERASDVPLEVRRGRSPAHRDLHVPPYDHARAYLGEADQREVPVLLMGTLSVHLRGEKPAYKQREQRGARHVRHRLESAGGSAEGSRPAETRMRWRQ